jgi:hypothetical protein
MYRIVTKQEGTETTEKKEDVFAFSVFSVYSVASDKQSWIRHGREHALGFDDSRQ